MKHQELKEVPKLPVTDYQELSDLQQSLLESLIIISQSPEALQGHKHIGNCIYWLAKIVLSSYPIDLLE